MQTDLHSMQEQHTMRVAEVIGQAVQVQRTKLGMSSRSDLSERVAAVGVKMNPSTVLRVENGQRQHVRVEELLALSAVLEVSPADLLTPPSGQSLDLGPYRLEARDVSNWLAGPLSQLPLGRLLIEPESPDLKALAQRHRAFPAFSALADCLGDAAEALTEGRPDRAGPTLVHALGLLQALLTVMLDPSSVAWASEATEQENER